ncbi:Ohr subfamily peroxiredoxin [Agromyces cerinus]|uniref:Ohr subfamily peroxiredoxin n=1 Tax=Agromyces hippuratus TaxID=286438 RepID=A0A852X228_9MICO|nr:MULTISPECIES: organic hydroperoxide resistance protein [Agromyces]MBM7832687.1 Ohr subfamily peroxiredoxin [Agromyces cerinus]NYG21494.1 Ohr subfamily peroxiredoxin [Agromyces hippuratus]
MNAIYTAVATSSGRDSRAVTSDGRLDVMLAMPNEMGGTGEGTNPEQLFAAGYAACFSTSLGIVAKRMAIDARDVAVTAEVSLVPRVGGSGFALATVLRVELPEHIAEGSARALIDATHQVCPYSNATQGNMPVEIVIE